MKIKTCHPTQLPLKDLKWENFIDLLGPAYASIARYDEILKRVKNPTKIFSILTEEEIFTSAYLPQQPVSFKKWLSYKASGYEKTMERVCDYRKALTEAQKEIKHTPFSLALIKKIHAHIKQSQGKANQTGRFRTYQNWIGPEGCSIEEAYFYPPDVKSLQHSLQNLKKYISFKERDPLIHLAIFIAQFLIIHPFMDGNGRVARILIPLFLYKRKLSSCPMFYVSNYLKKNRIEYFEQLFFITSENKWEKWIHFFLTGIIEEGTRLYTKAKKTLELYLEFSEEIDTLGMPTDLIDLLFASPISSRTKLHTYEKELKELEKRKWVRFYKTDALISLHKLLIKN
jgi:Fic family protein